MFTYQITPGTADVSVVIRIIDSTDGTPETGVLFNTSGIDLQYRREGAASTAITEATLAALTTAHADGGFLEIGNGYYRLDLPDAACATGAAGCLVHGTVTGMVVIGCYIQLEAAVNKVYSDTTIIYSDTTIATSKAAQIYSDTSIIYSDTSIIYSDTTISTSKATQIYSDTTAINTQTTTTSSKAVQIYSDTTIVASKVVQIYSDTTAIEAAGGTLTAAQDSKLTRVNSKATQVYSDTTVIEAGGGSLTAPQASQLTKAASKSTQIYSDTTIIYSDTTIATSKTTQIYSDTTITSSKAVQIYSDTTAAAAGTSPDVLVDTTITVTNQTTFVLAAGSADDNAYNGMAAILTDQTTTAQKWLSFVSDYVGSTKTVTLEAAPGFTIATGDSVAIMAAGGSSSVPVPAALSTAQASQVTKAASKATQIYSDSTAIDSKAVKVYSDTTIIYSDTTIATSKTTQIYSDTAITSSKAVQVYSDTTVLTAGVTLADGAHGGSSATITAKSIAVTNSDAGGVAVALTGSGTGNSHALSLLSTNGHALAAGSTNGNAINAASTSADAVSIAGGTNSDGLQIAGNGTGVDIRANITGNITGTLSELTAAVADSVPADGSRPSIAQAAYMLTQFMLERAVSGTTITVAKPDGTTALYTLTLDDGTSPTSVTRAT